MKRIATIALIFYLVLAGIDSNAQQRKISVHLISEFSNNSVSLRWAPKDYNSWQWSGKAGWVVERACLADTTIDGELLYSKIADQYSVQPMEQWKSVADTSEEAAIAAQLLFGQTFDISANANVEMIMNKYKEEQMKYSFAMTMAERNFKVAEMMGLGLKDKEFGKCQTIIYRVYAVQDSLTTSDTAYSVVNRKDPERKIRIYNIKHRVNDTSVLLYWPKVPFQYYFSFFEVSRSYDNQNFAPLSKEPYISLDNAAFSKKYFHYVDQLGFATDKVFYRVRGITPFGSYGPWSDTLALDLPDPIVPPSGLWYEVTPQENGVMLHWEYPEKLAPFVDHFEVYSARQLSGPKTKVGTSPKGTNQQLVQVAGSEVYLSVSAVAKDQTKMPGVPIFVQLDDSIPPAPPTQIKAEIDTTGLMTITWINDSVPDLFGHKIYYAHNRSVEFSQLTRSFVRDTVYRQKMDFGHLSPYVYLKFKAYDMRYNHSPFSEIIKVRLPDTIPPSEPLFFRPLVKDDGVHFRWKPSNSPDVAAYVFTAENKRTNEKDTLVQLPANKPYEHIYQPQKSMKCKIKLVARDSSGNISTARSQYSVAFDAIVLQQLKPVFTVKADYNASSIQIRWTAPENITRVKLFRSTNDGPLRLYKTLPAVPGYFRDTQVKVGEKYQYRLQWQNGQHVNSKMSDAKVVDY